MATTKKKAYIPTNVPHIAWIDLHKNNVLHEIAIMKEDVVNGDIYFIPISSLDQIDKLRLLKIVKKRDAAKMPLWELMSHETLKNGINALVMFHQLVKVRTVQGKILTVGSGQRGTGITNMSEPPTVMDRERFVNEELSAPETAQKVTEVKKAKKAE